MIKANYSDKKLIVDILTASFDKNKSVNYVAKQDKKREKRIKALMDYSFEQCWNYGDVFLSEDRKGTLLTLSSEKKKLSFNSILLDLKLVFKTIGIRRVAKVLKRESLIKAYHPNSFIYLWYIGVLPEYQGKGIGGKMLNDLLQIAKNNPIYLETSTLENLPFYKRYGFKVYGELSFNYKLFLLNIEPNNL